MVIKKDKSSFPYYPHKGPGFTTMWLAITKLSIMLSTLSAMVRQMQLNARLEQTTGSFVTPGELHGDSWVTV